MAPRPQAEDSDYSGNGKLQGKVALITGGDSGIGRAVAIAFVKQGVDVWRWPAMWGTIGSVSKS
jgi:hypothetical protein